MTTGLRAASLLVCGLFVAEDPAVVSARTRLGGGHVPGLAIDLVLAASMVAYNFAASRWVVSVGRAARIPEAIAMYDAERSSRIAADANPLRRLGRRLPSLLNPFNLIKLVGERLGRDLDRLSAATRRHRLRVVTAVLEDLAAVNILGVPGAGLAVTSTGRPVARRDSLRHSALFVASWFVGAHALGWMVGHSHRLPYAGAVAANTTAAIGDGFAALTDVTAPVGALTVAAVTVAVVSHASRIERLAGRPRSTMENQPAPPDDATPTR